MAGDPNLALPVSPIASNVAQILMKRPLLWQRP